MTKQFKILFITITYLSFISIAFQAQNIYTYAGKTIWGFYGDGGPAVKAQLYNPTGVAIDAAGNVYIADSQNHRIRKVTPSGTITTIAGTGVAGFSGDSGLAINAKFYYPTDVAVDGAGNVYVADQYNNRIRMINPGGTITTVAGNGQQGFGGDNGPATKAKLNWPRTVAVDGAGNLFIADYYNCRIRKVTSTGTISTYCGTGVYGYNGNYQPRLSAQMSYPWGIDVDAAGNVYFSDCNNCYIRKIDVAGVVSVLAGTGTYGYSGDDDLAVFADLRDPGGLSVTASGVVYFTDKNSGKVRKVENDTIKGVAGIVCHMCGTYWGDGVNATSTYLFFPYDVCVDRSTGDFYIADQNNQRIRRVAAGSNTISTIAGGGTGGYAGDGGSALNAEFDYPTGIDIDAAKNVYIADTYNSVIRKIDPTGVVTTIAGNGVAGYSGDNGPATAAQLNQPYDVKYDQTTGNIYIADKSNHRIRMVTPSGTIITVAGNGIQGFSGDNGLAVNAKLSNPWGVAISSTGNLFISDYSNARVRKVTTGTITTIAGTGSGGFSGDDTTIATLARISGPKGIDVDAAGNVYFADFFNHRIRKIMTTGTITTVAGNGIWGYSGDGTPAKNATLKNPTSVSVDALGQLYICDNSNHVVRFVNSVGTMTTFAGNGIPGFSGDGGPATGARFRYPYAVAFDPSGNVYVTDSYNNRVREVCLTSCAIGIDELTPSNTNSNIFIYPNPNNGEFTIKVKQEMTLNILNELGQFVGAIRLNEENDFQTHINNLSTGVYFISSSIGGIKEKIVVIK